MTKRKSDFTALCEFLVKKVPVRTVILFGSMARGEATNISDIDLLLITKQRVNKRDIKKMIPKSLMPNKKLCLSVYSADQVDSAYTNGSLFLVHLLKEGQILYDDGFFKELSSNAFIVSSASMMLSLRIFEQRLEAVNNLQMYNKHFVRLFSDFYRMAKSIAFILLANEGNFEFNRGNAFAKIARKYPDYEQPIKKLQELEPFFIKTHRGTPQKYPFNPVVSTKKVEEMRTHLRELITLGETEIAC